MENLANIIAKAKENMRSKHVLCAYGKHYYLVLSFTGEMAGKPQYMTIAPQDHGITSGVIDTLDQRTYVPGVAQDVQLTGHAYTALEAVWCA